MVDQAGEVSSDRHERPEPLVVSHMPEPDEGPTTHSAYGAGHPRLVMIGVEGSEEPRVFPLEGETTRIGSADDNEIVLEGLLPHHATITHTAADEYSLDSIGETQTSSAGEESPFDDAPKGALLRHGATFTIAGWGFSFQREEYADHGRPFGGREGGEFDAQSEQGPPPDYTGAHDRAQARE